jgi:type I restriction-modification system DNA methylase subunit
MEPDNEFGWMKREAREALSFEQLLAAISRKEDKQAQLSVGSFYTVSALSRQIVEKALSDVCRRLRKDPSFLKHVRIVDPFVGSGSFLIEAFHVLV